MKHSEIIKKIRSDVELSQSKFADLLEVNASLINNIENGKSNIKFELAKKINKKFGYNIEKLMQGCLDKDLSTSDEELKKELNLTDKDFDTLVNIVKQDRERFFLFCRACAGDKQAAKQLKKLL
jgi:DNA-binding XRE family transcriptional regulator